MSQVVNEKDVNEKVVSERGTGGATFAAVVMIIGGTFGFFEGLSLIVGGTYYVQPANYWISTGRGHVGLVAPDCGPDCPSGWVWSHPWGGLGPLARHHLREHSGSHQFPLYTGPAVLGDHPHPDRLVDHSLPVRSPTRARLTLRAAELAHPLIHYGLNDRR